MNIRIRGLGVLDSTFRHDLVFLSLFTRSPCFDVPAGRTVILWFIILGLLSYGLSKEISYEKVKTSDEIFSKIRRFRR